MKHHDLEYYKINSIGMFEEYDSHLYIIYFGMRSKSIIRSLYTNFISDHDMLILSKIYNKPFEHQI